MKKNSKINVSIIMGSQSDYSTMKYAEKTLKSLGIKFEKKIVSAHRTPKRMYEYASNVEKKNINVIIAGAGGSAHLPGMVASLTKIPVAILIGTSNSLSAKAMEREILPSGLCHFFPFRPFPLVCLSAVTTRISLFELILLHSSLVESIN